MKKYISLFIIFSFLASCNESKSQEITKTTQAKKIKKIDYINANKFVYLTQYFDKNGNKIEEVNHSEKFGDSKKRFIYDKKNRLIEETFFGNDGKLIKSKFNKFTAINDKELLKTTYVKRANGDEQLLKEERKFYDNNGFLVKMELKSNYDSRTINYTNSKNGKLLKEIIIAFDDTEKVVKTYNSNQKPITEKIYRRKTKKDTFKLVQTNKWYYDSNGNETDKNGKLNTDNFSFTKNIVYY